MLPLCLDQGIGVTAWSALARGFLAGNRSAGGGGETARAKTDAFAQSLYYKDGDFAVQARLAEIAEARGVPPMQVALAWIASRPGVTAPIIGATKIAQLEQSFGATDIVLDADEIARMEEVYVARPIARILGAA